VADARAPLEAMFEAILAEVESRIPGEITERAIEYI
jgi:hypothetical protein